VGDEDFDKNGVSFWFSKVNLLLLCVCLSAKLLIMMRMFLFPWNSHCAASYAKLPTPQQ
jgi:hypothetical protein